MRNTYRRLIIAGVLTAFGLSTVLPVFAGSTGRRNTAIVLTAATVHQFLHKRKANAVVLGLGAAQAWKSYEDARKRESGHRGYRVHRPDRRQSRGREYAHRDRAPRGHAYGYYGETPRGHAYGHRKHHGREEG